MRLLRGLPGGGIGSITLVLACTASVACTEPEPPSELDEADKELAAQTARAAKGNEAAGAAKTHKAHTSTRQAQEEDSRTRTHMKAAGQLGPGRGTLIIGLAAPEGAKLTEGGPLKVSARGKHMSFPQSLDTKLDPDELPIRLPVDVVDGATGPAEVDLTYYYCTSGDDGSCQPEHAYLNVELDLSGGAAGGEAHFEHSPGIL